jgi:archaeal flagellar protein FlaJ
MGFKIPFTFSTIDTLKKRSKFFNKFIKYKKKSSLSLYLKNSQIELNQRDYISICLRTFIYTLILLFIIFTAVLWILKIEKYLLFGVGLSFAFSFFMLFSQIMYPKIYSNRRQKDIERNLHSALEDIMVQLNSGIPLFDVLVNISDADYGELSIEFKKAVKKINAGSPEQVVLEELSKNNPSNFFKKTLWQISNGMNAGSDMSFVVRESIKSINEEQLIQIQNYGNKLNPLMVLYMLIAVIVPALSVTFLTILSSMISLDKNSTMMLFAGLFVAVMFVQIMFLGIIKSKRPTLL